MNIIKRVALFLSLVFFSALIIAEDTPKGSIVSPNETLMHIEMAKVEISKNDFIPPSQHINAARESGKKVTGNPDVVKKASACILQAQIKVKQGDIKGATVELDKAITLYKSL